MGLTRAESDSPTVVPVDAGSGVHAILLCRIMAGMPRAMTEYVLDSVDLRLLHALQLRPRAPWTALAGVLGADPVTLARRWQRIAEEGTAYVTAVQAASERLVIAFLEISTPPSAVETVVRRLTLERAVVTVDRTSGDRSVMATVFAESVGALGEWAASMSSALAAVTTMRTHLVTNLVADARSWRLRALTTAEVKRVTMLGAVVPDAPRLPPPARARLATALAEDVRAPAAVLAAAAGVAPRAVAPTVAWMLGTGEVTIRIDVARALTAWPVQVWYFLRTSPATVDRVTHQLSRLPEMRVVATTVGRSNVVTSVWLQSLPEVRHFETVLHDRLPGVDIEDRAVVLRTEKHVGHLLDARGLATGVVTPFVPAGSG